MSILPPLEVSGKEVRHYGSYVEVSPIVSDEDFTETFEKCHSYIDDNSARWDVLERSEDQVECLIILLHTKDLEEKLHIIN